MTFPRLALAAIGLVSLLAAQQKKPFQAQSSSTVSYTAKGTEEILEIRNVTYEVTGDRVSGLPKDERLLLRKTTHSKETIGDIDSDSTVTMEAWPLGADLKTKPLYALALTGTDAHVRDGGIIVVSRGVEEVDWWSVYKLGNGQHLFDTYVPLLSFSISRETLTTRYVGLEVPPDDISDTRLKDPKVVAVLTYASGDRVIREALLTCDDPQRAAQLRSFADEERVVSLVEAPARAIRIAFSESYPSAPNTVVVQIPVLRDDLDVSHAQLPARMHAVAWKR